MKEIEIDQNSRLYRWVRKMNCIRDWEVEDGYIDSCGFNKAILQAFGLSLLISAAALGIAWIMLKSIAEVCTWIFASYMFGFWIQISEAGAAGLFLFCAIAVLASFLSFVWIIESGKLNKKLNINIPPVAGKLYESFKEKYCKKIKFKERIDGEV